MHYYQAHIEPTQMVILKYWLFSNWAHVACKNINKMIFFEKKRSPNGWDKGVIELLKFQT